MANGDRGSVRWHQNRWEIRVQQDGRRVTRRVKAPNTRAGRRFAEEQLEQLLAEVSVDAESLTVDQLLDRYRLVKGPKWSPSTRATFTHHTKAIRSELGRFEISALRFTDIEAVYSAWEADGVKPSTIRRRHAILRAAFNLAVRRWALIMVSPCDRVELPAADTAKAVALVDAGQVLKAIGLLEHERLKVLARLAVATGARRGELVALRWSDVDLDAGTVRIAGAVAIGEQSLERKGTKGGEARSAMRIDDGTIAVLKAWRSKVSAEAMLLGIGRPGPDAPLVPSPSDPRQPWHPDRVTAAWIRNRPAIGLDGMRWHDLRHLHATALLDAGVRPSTVAARLGHASTKMTLDVYSHAVPADDEVAADVIGRAAGDT